MTTRKQKREEMEIKREQRLADERASGLSALKEDQERREKKRRDAQRPTHEKKHSWKKIDKDCLFCQDLLVEQRRAQKELEATKNG